MLNPLASATSFIFSFIMIFTLAAYTYWHKNILICIIESICFDMHIKIERDVIVGNLEVGSIVAYRLLPRHLPKKPDRLWLGKVTKIVTRELIYVSSLEPGYEGQEDSVFMKQVVSVQDQIPGCAGALIDTLAITMLYCHHKASKQQIELNCTYGDDGDDHE